MNTSFWNVIRAFAFSVFVVSAVLVGFTIYANAHEAMKTAAQPDGWKYPWACCSNMDCRMLDHKAVLERLEGYVIVSTGEVVAYLDKRIKDSPDGEYHLCAHQAGVNAGHTICLFVPPKGY